MFIRKTAAAIIGATLILATNACAPSYHSGSTHNSAKAMSDSSEHHDHNPLPLPKRLAFMTGHVEAGLALYRAGEPEMAAKHLQHPVSETHASERVGLDALGFDANLFVAVAEALEAGVPAAQIEPQLKAAQQNLAVVSARAGGDTRDIIHFLLDTIIEEYSAGVQNGVVSVPGEYQDAFGFAIVAIERAHDLHGPAKNKALTRLDTLLNAWPQAPVPPEHPTDVDTVTRLVNAVRDVL